MPLACLALRINEPFSLRISSCLCRNSAAPANKPSAEPAGETVLTIDDCILEELCVNNEIDADDFDVSLLTIDDDIFEYHERNVQRKKCARKSESRRSRPQLRERVASGCRGRQVRPGTCHRTRW